MNNPVLLFVLGTRPEAIKCAPVIRACQEDAALTTRVLTTSQHRQIQDEVLHFFGITPDHDLDLMGKNPNLTALIANAWTGLSQYLQEQPADLLLVQGDTSTAFIAALTAQYQKIPVAHIEAGLRTHDKSMPFPEEINRRLIGCIADLHFAPTEQARENLLKVNIEPSAIHVVGNSGIDALLYMRRHAESHPREVPIPAAEKSLLVTCHRRENWGKNIENLCQALHTLCQENPRVSIVFLVHPNPMVSKPVQRHLGGIPNITLLNAVNYRQMAYYLNAADVVLTDSGGIQEEAPVLGKPVLVLRDKTERPEGVKQHSAILTGTDPAAIVKHATRLLNDSAYYKSHAKEAMHYGDGKTAQRILNQIRTYFSLPRR
ncbi:UDP-N-acetylglucosamine 2-epimerase (non-hydrolyzing) [bacterium]|nr:UDP-N-acetylglucosamine 2-epimerase (non-hydrolyzing) [bacterium]